MTATGKIKRAELSSRMARTVSGDWEATQSPFCKNKHLTDTRINDGPPNHNTSVTAVRDGTSIHKQVETIIHELLGTMYGGMSVPLDLTSRHALELTEVLSAEFKYRLPSLLVFNYPTGQSISNFIESIQDAAYNGQTSTTLCQPSTGRQLTPGQTDSLQTLTGLSMATPALSSGNAQHPLTTPTDYWESMIAADVRDTCASMPSDRWGDVDSLYNPGMEHEGMYTRHASFVADVSAFDAGAFRMSQAASLRTDPQHRKLLQVAADILWKSSSDSAGTDIQSTHCAVHVGCMWSGEYLSIMSEMNFAPSPHKETGNGMAFLAGRVSFVFGLTGPCTAINTACSSSLLALHIAYIEMRVSDVPKAAVGGVNLSLRLDTTLNICLLRALSPEGRCKTFDNSANGYGRGEGCAVVSLECSTLQESPSVHSDVRLGTVSRTSLAQVLLAGTSTNQDGRSSSFTAPSGTAQQNLILEASVRAGCAPHNCGFISVHGTGTGMLAFAGCLFLPANLIVTNSHVNCSAN